MSNNQLFRQEALEYNKNKQYGTVLINTPLPYKLLTLGVSILVVLVCLFLLFGEFSEKFVVRGYLESTTGMARVYPNKNGVVAKSFVQEGDEVQKGDTLFLIDTSYDGLNKKNKPSVRAQLEKNRRSIERQIDAKHEHVQALKPLLDKKYISLATYNEQHDELVALQQQKNNVDIEILNDKHEQSYLIRAPMAGIISSMLYREGQYTQAEKPMLKILPKNANLMASLFIPVKQSGFLHKNNKVIIRYDAFPYARFGGVGAYIDGISQSILTDVEEDKPIRIGEPYYKVTARLEQQFVRVYGQQKHMRHGMTVTAVIVGSRRKLWQWILDPIYSFSGGLLV